MNILPEHYYKTKDGHKAFVFKKETLEISLGRYKTVIYGLVEYPHEKFPSVILKKRIEWDKEGKTHMTGYNLIDEWKN